MTIPAVHPDTDSGDSTTNIFREDLLIPPLSFDKLSEPPSFYSLRARDTRPAFKKVKLIVRLKEIVLCRVLAFVVSHVFSFVSFIYFVPFVRRA